jgi:hypothetical protein
MSDIQNNNIGDEKTIFSAERDLVTWMKQAKTQGLCIKMGHYEKDGTFKDYGTIWDLSEIYYVDTAQVTDTEFRFRMWNTEYKLYIDNYPMDDFGQIVTFRNPPACYWFYFERGDNCVPDFISKYDPHLEDDQFEEPDTFTIRANSKYPDSFSVVSEFLDTDIGQDFYICYTYNPKLTKKEVLKIMRELGED